jgi:hypothetical protein
MVERKLPPVLVTLLGTVFDARVHRLLFAIASAGTGTEKFVRQSLAEAIAPHLLSLLGPETERSGAGTETEEGVALVRRDILKLLLKTYRTDNVPPRFLGDRPEEKRKSAVVYAWDRNEWTSFGLGERVVRGAAAFGGWLRGEESGGEVEG